MWHLNVLGGMLVALKRFGGMLVALEKIIESLYFRLKASFFKKCLGIRSLSVVTTFYDTKKKNIVFHTYKNL